MLRFLLAICSFSFFTVHTAEKTKYPDSAFIRTGLNIEKPAKENSKTEILIIPGSESVKKPSGNHEYMAGGALLMDIFNKMENVHAVLSNYDWPENEKLIEKADVIVFYGNGDGKQGFFAKSERIEIIKNKIKSGVGFVNLHASICYPEPHVKLGQKWIGGVWTDKYSKGNRGHWKSSHEIFPKHEITSGVTPWKADDGWCHKILIPAENRENITPLLWSSKTHKGDPKGGDNDIVAWTFQRPDGGRSFSCSGAHGHWEWANDGLRQMIVNGILWSAGLKVPANGFECKIDKPNMNRFFDIRKK